MNRDDRREFTSWWVLYVSLLVATLIVLGILGYAGIFTKTVVERKVFEQSHQYRESQRAQIATYEAQLAEMEKQLTSPDLNANTRANIEAQIASIRIQLNAVRIK